MACGRRAQVESVVCHQAPHAATAEHSREAGAYGSSRQFSDRARLAASALSNERLLLGLRSGVQILPPIRSSRICRQERGPLTSANEILMSITLLIYSFCNFSIHSSYLLGTLCTLLSL